MPEPSLAQLLRARGGMARVVHHYGEKYWPLFDMLVRECKAREMREKRLAEAMQAISSVHDAGHEVTGERQRNL
ncbi:MAG: hypothetical protein AAF234_16160 [Pseudomonadota bacterium]